MEIRGEITADRGSIHTFDDLDTRITQDSEPAPRHPRVGIGQPCNDTIDTRSNNSVDTWRGAARMRAWLQSDHQSGSAGTGSCIGESDNFGMRTTWSIRGAHTHDHTVAVHDNSADRWVGACDAARGTPK